MPSKHIRDIRIQIDDATHAAVKVLAGNAGLTLDRWVADLVRNEVCKQLALARQLTATITEKDLVRIEQSPIEKTRKIYFIERGANGPIKIGMAIHPEKRLAILQTACAEQLRILFSVEQTAEFSERKIQHRFRHLQRGGEWYAREAELLDFIESLQEPSRKIAESGDK